MTREQAINYMFCSGFSEEQVSEVVRALTYEPTTKNYLGVDCISRQEVLDLINADWKYEGLEIEINNLPSVTQEPQTFKWCTDCKEYDQEKHCCHRWSKVIRNTVEEMKQEPRWIPVSEYLPVTNDEVLVTYIVNGNAKKRYVETANCFDGEWSSVNDEYRIPNTKIEIIAWCEMPKPYKAETEEKKDG